MPALDAQRLQDWTGIVLEGYFPGVLLAPKATLLLPPGARNRLQAKPERG